MISQIHWRDTFTQENREADQAWADANLIDEAPPIDDNILFETKFDGAIDVVYNSTGHELINTGNGGEELPYDFPGLGLRLGDPGGDANYFNYVSGGLDLSTPAIFEDYFKTYIETGLTIPGTTTTTALYQEFIKKYNNGSTTFSTRNQYNIRADSAGDIYNRLDQGYIKMKNYCHISGVNQPADQWLLPWEWKQESDRWARFGLYMYGLDSTPYWYFHVQDMDDDTQAPGTILYSETNNIVPVPFDEWYDTEIFWIGSSNASVGRVQLAINGVVVFDYEGITKEVRTGSDDVPYYMGVMKVYGLDSTMKTTDMIWAKEPIEGSVLRGSGV